MVLLTGKNGRAATEWERVALLLTIARDENEMDERSEFLTMILAEALYIARRATGEDMWVAEHGDDDEELREWLRDKPTPQPPRGGLLRRAQLATRRLVGQ